MSGRIYSHMRFSESEETQSNLSGSFIADDNDRIQRDGSSGSSDDCSGASITSSDFESEDFTASGSDSEYRATTKKRKLIPDVRRSADDSDTIDEPECNVIPKKCKTVSKVQLSDGTYDSNVTDDMDKAKQRDFVLSLLAVPRQSDQLALIIDAPDYAVFKLIEQKRKEIYEADPATKFSKVVCINGVSYKQTDNDAKCASRYNLHRFSMDMFDYIATIKNQKVFLFWGDFMSGYFAKYKCTIIKQKYKSAREIFNSLFTHSLVDESTVFIIVLNVARKNSSDELLYIESIINDANSHNFTTETIYFYKQRRLIEELSNGSYAWQCEDVRSMMYTDTTNSLNYHVYADRPKSKMLYIDFKLIDQSSLRSS